jgi:DNA-binding response OmpR family regulator
VKDLRDTILVVEDDADWRRMLEDVLTGAAFRVLTAQNGAEALRVIAKESPDLIVLDLLLPWINGVEVLSTLRSLPMLGKVPVLIVTGSGTTEDDLRAFRPIRVLTKPLDLDRLVPTSQQLLRQPSASRP